MSVNRQCIMGTCLAFFECSKWSSTPCSPYSVSNLVSCFRVYSVCVVGGGLCLRVEDKGRLQCPAILGHLSRGLEPCRWLVSPSNPPASVPHSAGVTAVHSHESFFFGREGFTFGSEYLHSKHSYVLSHLPSHCTIFCP